MLVVATILALWFFRRKYARQRSALLQPYLFPGPRSSHPGSMAHSNSKQPLRDSLAALALAPAADETIILPSESSGSLEPAAGFVESTFVTSGPQSESPAAHDSGIRSDTRSRSEETFENATPVPGQAASHPVSDHLSGSQPADLEQIDVIRTLQNANVPAADIAHMIERIRSGVFDEGLRSRAVGVDIGNIQSGAPPSYDSLRR